MNRKRLSILLSGSALVGILGLLALRADEAQTDRPLPPEDAARTMEVPPGFQVTAFAAEPDVRQPISLCLDDRGRVWVAEAYSYPTHSKESKRDRILVFEDTDGDGRHDKRTVFYDKLNYVTGVEVGFGGVWVMSPPYLYFIADRDQDDKPDGEPEVVLDGFGNFANAHNLANGFAWGPDGWLYGTHGRTNWSMIGRPGDPKEKRVRFDGGVYRYHPVRKVWEPYVDGCTNPWGIDWDDYGQAFIPNTVNPHLFHAIPGAHFEPWRNRESSRFAYRRIETIADHLHFSGGGDVRAGLGSEEESKLGGGHAHCGIMVYLGDDWPKQYRNTVFTHNTHGRRINNDILKRSGSGYVATHGADFLQSNDPWFMGVMLQYGPDGVAYSIDWSDTGECHSVRNTRRATGRIFQIRYGDPHPEKRGPALDMSRLSNEHLVRFQLHPNDWYVRHARRILQERAARDDELGDTKQQLLTMLREHRDATRRLRALWTLHGIGATNDQLLLEVLDDSTEYVRAWAINLLCEDKDPPAEALTRFAALAAENDSPLVRLHLASNLQRLSFSQRWPIARRLAARGEDRDDQNLPHMIWYAIEPLVHEDVARFAELAAEAKLPLVRNHVARRIASLPQPEKGLNALASSLKRAGDEARGDALEGMLTGLRGRRGLSAPDGWAAVAASMRDNQSLYEKALAVSLAFSDPAAISHLRNLVNDAKASPEVRERAIGQLVDAGPRQLDEWLLQWLKSSSLRRAAIRGLARHNHPDTAERILNIYQALSPLGRRDALQTLATRAAWAAQLLDAVDRGDVPRTDLTAFTVRQIGELGDKSLRERIERAWGEFRSTPADKRRQIKQLKRQLTSQLDARDRSHGRAVYHKTCGACHKLFDDGGNRGPNLTGAQRNNLDYLLEHIVDPNSSVSRDYQLRVVQLADGRVINGLVAEETETTLTLRTLNEDVVVGKGEIDTNRAGDVSMMPEKLLDELTKRQLRDLIAYLQGGDQVPFPSGFEPGAAGPKASNPGR